MDVLLGEPTWPPCSTTGAAAATGRPLPAATAPAVQHGHRASYTPRAAESIIPPAAAYAPS